MVLACCKKIINPIRVESCGEIKEVRMREIAMEE